VLDALKANSDHMPVVADYQLPAVMNATLASVPSNVAQGALVPLDVFVQNVANVLTASGADELDYVVSVSGSLVGTDSGTALPLGGSVSSQVFLDTASPGFKFGTVTVTATSQGAANSVFNFPVSYTVGSGSGGPVFGVVAKDTFDDDLNLTSYAKSPSVAFTDPADGFGEFQVGVSATIPNSLKDDSLNGTPNDALGVINTVTKTDRWFGINDLTNPSNPAGTGTVTWEFNITDVFDLQVSLDMAAMGDFEPSDVYNWTYQIDGGSVFPLFTSSVDDNNPGVQYTMADGDIVTLADPLSMTDAEGTVVQLSNVFQTLTSELVGNGSVLRIVLNAANDADEPYAFDNLIVEGTRFVFFLAADFNQDGNVDSLDLAQWQGDYGLNADSDADEDGDTDGADFLVWQQQFGQSTLPLVASSTATTQVPEPAGLLLALVACGGLTGRRSKRLAP
jgi:hypothetical protein